MANKLKIKRSSVPGKVPTTTDLDLGELAINTYDGKAYMKKNVSGVESVVLLTGAGAGDVTGPNSAADNAFARFDGITGKIIQNSPGASLSDTGVATFAGLSLTTTPLGISSGGTGATTAGAALTNLGAFASAGGTITGGVTIAVGADALTIGNDTNNARMLRLNGAGYTGAIGLDSAGMKIGQNSSARDLQLQVANTTYFGISSDGTLYKNVSGSLYTSTLTNAWVTFNGTNGTIQSSYNVASISWPGTGQYYINLSQAQANSNLCISGIAGSSGYGLIGNWSTSSQVYVASYSPGAGYGNNTPVCVAIHR